MEKKSLDQPPTANPAILKKELVLAGYRNSRLYINELEHLGQVVTESVKARAQTGMAKNRKMRIMMIRSENFFLFMARAHPFSSFHTAFPMPREKQNGQKPPNNPVADNLSNNFK